MITQEITERTVVSSEQLTSTGNKGFVNSVERIKTKTPLTVAHVITDQREQALKSKGFNKITDNKYVKYFDDLSQRMLFVIFNEHNTKIINRENNLDIGNIIYESNNVKYLEDIEEYLN